MVARNDVVEIQLAPVKMLRTILTSVPVALEDVVPGEFHFLVRQPVEEQQHDHARNANLERDGAHHIVAVVIARDIAPFVEIKGLEVAAGFRDDLGVPHVQQRERALDRADIDRLPEAIEHEHVLIERVSHTAAADYHTTGVSVNRLPTDWLFPRLNRFPLTRMSRALTSIQIRLNLRTTNDVRLVGFASLNGTNEALVVVGRRLE